MFADSWASQRPPCKASCCTVWTIVRLPEWSFTRCEWPDLGLAHHELIHVARGIQYSIVQADTDPPVQLGGGGLSNFKHALFALRLQQAISPWGHLIHPRSLHNRQRYKCTDSHCSLQVEIRISNFFFFFLQSHKGAAGATLLCIVHQMHKNGND